MSEMWDASGSRCGIVPRFVATMFLAFACAPQAHAADPSTGLNVPPVAGLSATLPEAPQASLDLVASSSHSSSSLPSFRSTPALSASASGAVLANSTTAMTTLELDRACQSGELHGNPCHIHWLPILWQSFEANALQNVGNIALDTETRQDLRHNDYWSTYVYCVDNFRYDQWRDDDDFVVDYLGHGMQGAGVAAIFEQNDPHGRGLVYVNNGNYWRSRLKAMAWVSVYEVQWKLGPVGESSIGNSGLHTYSTPSVHGRTTNETGFQDLVDTPLVGLGWNIGEDALDRFLMPKIWSRTHNRFLLTALFVLTPTKAAANIMRFKPLYYRDFPLTPLR